MWIDYSDSEVRTFHPICQTAIKKALANLNLSNIYEVVHHEMFGPIEADFVIKNKQTKKYLCVIEVKRTLADTQSTRYQYQAMTYVLSAGSLMEKPFYIITNLENSYMFRHSDRKASNYQQMLEPGLITIGHFEDYTKEEFIEKLSQKYEKMIKNIMDENYEYLVTLDNVIDYISEGETDIILWRTNLAILLYEYIRGAFDAVGRSEFKNINLYLNDVYSICEEASRIDFNPIFKYNENEMKNTYEIERSTLDKVYQFGKNNISGEIIANLIHEIISKGKEQDGEVPTDIELANFASILANIYNDNKKINCICDPAAGSGSLISSSVNILNLNPSQIKVNDINERLLQLLSVRLGLIFPSSISNSNTAMVTSKDIADLNEEYFSDVDIILMNPPYVAGVRPKCKERKKILSNKIKNISGTNSITNVGQAGLEYVFLELVQNYITKDTVVSCIMPKQALYQTGIESQTFRKYLIENYGLSAIFVYSGETVFNSVIKDTVILIGRKGFKCKTISVIHSLVKIQDIDMKAFTNIVKSNYDEIKYDTFRRNVQAQNICIENISVDMFKKNVNTGWHFVSLEREEIEGYIKSLDMMDTLIKIKDSKYNNALYRGKAGNFGGSELLFLKKDSKFLLNGEYIPAIRNAKLDGLLIENGDSCFYCGKNKELLINEYILTQEKNSGSQVKKVKDYNDCNEILIAAEKAIVFTNSILIPRNLRKYGKVYLLNKDALVSTNFIVMEIEDKEEAIMLSSWMATIFYQLISEIFAVTHEGTRKMEKSNIIETYIPTGIIFSKEEVEFISNYLNNFKFTLLERPEITEIDRFWAKKLFKENADEMLEKTRGLLKRIVSVRQRRI